MTEILLCAILFVNLAQWYNQSEAARRWVRDARLRFAQWRTKRNGN